MAKKSSNNDTKTVSGTLKNGTQVTVSEDLAAKLGARFTAGKSRSSSSS